MSLEPKPLDFGDMKPAVDQMKPQPAQMEPRPAQFPAERQPAAQASTSPPTKLFADGKNFDDRFAYAKDQFTSAYVLHADQINKWIRKLSRADEFDISTLGDVVVRTATDWIHFSSPLLSNVVVGQANECIQRATASGSFWKQPIKPTRSEVEQLRTAVIAVARQCADHAADVDGARSSLVSYLAALATVRHFSTVDAVITSLDNQRTICHQLMTTIDATVSRLTHVKSLMADRLSRLDQLLLILPPR